MARLAVMVRPTYDDDLHRHYERQAECPLCGESVGLRVIERTTRVRVNTLIPIGCYHEHEAVCPSCGRCFLIDPEAGTALLPSPQAKAVFYLAWLCLIVPLLGFALMVWAVRLLPCTSNWYLQWAKIGLFPSALISLVVCLAVIMGLIF